MNLCASKESGFGLSVPFVWELFISFNARICSSGFNHTTYTPVSNRSAPHYVKALLLVVEIEGCTDTAPTSNSEEKMKADLDTDVVEHRKHQNVTVVDEKTSVTGEGKTPEASEAQTHVASEEKTRVSEDVQVSEGARQTLASQEGQFTATGEDQMPTSVEDKTPATGEGKTRTAVGEDQTPAAGEGKTPTDGENPSKDRVSKFGSNSFNQTYDLKRLNMSSPSV